MTNDLCPEDETLASYLAGALDDARLCRVEDHLNRCGRCLDIVCQHAAAQEAPGIPAETGTFRTFTPVQNRVGGGVHTWRPRLRSRPWKAAAAILTLFGAGIMILRYSAPQHARNPHEAIRTSHSWPSTGQAGTARLPDGSLIAVSAGTIARLEPPAPGERVRIRLERGELDLDVAKGTGAFRILAPPAEVRVLGTRFSLRTVPLDGSTALCVEMREGTVELRQEDTSARLMAGQRGIALAGEGVYALEAGLQGERPWLDLARILDVSAGGVRIPPGKVREARLIAVQVWGTRWGSGWEWRSMLGPMHPPEQRAAAVWLVKTGAPAGALEALHRARQLETDPLLQQAIDEAVSFLQRKPEKQ